MKHMKRAGVTGIAAVACLVCALPSALAVGPQALPAIACNAGTLGAGQNAPTQRAAEAIPHIEHAVPFPVPYCHHVNPAATPPSGG
jgi:hypothetical protein